MPRQADFKSIPQIKRLWHECFGDSEEYISFFVDNCFSAGGADCIVEENNGVIVSMLFLINCSVGGFSGKYIYAVCTAELFRKQGIMSKLLTYVRENIKSDFLCLVPAEEQLFDLYKKNGFEKFFYNSVETFENESSFVNQKDISFQEFKKIRNEFQCNIVNWNENVLKYMFNENKFIGGKNLFTNSGYAIIREDGGICEVVEWLSRDYNVRELFEITSCRKISVRKPLCGVGACNGMIYTEKDMSALKGAFLSLVLD